MSLFGRGIFGRGFRGFTGFNYRYDVELERKIPKICEIRGKLFLAFDSTLSEAADDLVLEGQVDDHNGQCPDECSSSELPPLL